MKTIEERAEEYANECWTLDEANFACEDGYIKGATEQIEIDIAKACEWINNNWRNYTGVDQYGVITFGGWENAFHKVMKGE